MTQKIPKAKRRENATYYISPEAKRLVRQHAKDLGLSQSLVADGWLRFAAYKLAKPPIYMGKARGV